MYSFCYAERQVARVLLTGGGRGDARLAGTTFSCLASIDFCSRAAATPPSERAP